MFVCIPDESVQYFVAVSHPVEKCFVKYMLLFQWSYVVKKLMMRLMLTVMQASGKTKRRMNAKDRETSVSEDSAPSQS